MFFLAWSPVRRTNAGRFEVEHPGDYATLNSYQPRDATVSDGCLTSEERNSAMPVAGTARIVPVIRRLGLPRTAASSPDERSENARDLLMLTVILRSPRSGRLEA